MPEALARFSAVLWGSGARLPRSRWSDTFCSTCGNGAAGPAGRKRRL